MIILNSIHIFKYHVAYTSQKVYKKKKKYII